MFPHDDFELTADLWSWMYAVSFLEYDRFHFHIFYNLHLLTALYSRKQSRSVPYVDGSYNLF